MKLFEIRDEAQRQAQPGERARSRTKTADRPDLSAFDRAFADQVAGSQNVPAAQQQGQEERLPSRPTASRGRTRSAAASATMSPEAGEKLSFLSRLGLEDEISDEEAADRAGASLWDDDDDEGEVPTPTRTGTELTSIENMPTVVGQQLDQAGVENPEWHQVKHLPGYLQSAIRAMGRQVFGSFTRTPIEDIQVVANVGGGPNTEREVKAVATWLHSHGKKDTDGEMDFQQSIPDYGADFAIYKKDGFTFMVVKDFAGHYIYSWPTSDEKSSKGSERPAIDVDRRRLR